MLNLGKWVYSEKISHDERELNHGEFDEDGDDIIFFLYFFLLDLSLKRKRRW